MHWCFLLQCVTKSKLCIYGRGIQRRINFLASSIDGLIKRPLFFIKFVTEGVKRHVLLFESLFQMHQGNATFFGLNVCDQNQRYSIFVAFKPIKHCAVPLFTGGVNNLSPESPLMLHSGNPHLLIY